jgi:hypothetical protein
VVDSAAGRYYRRKFCSIRGGKGDCNVTRSCGSRLLTRLFSPGATRFRLSHGGAGELKAICSSCLLATNWTCRV